MKNLPDKKPARRRPDLNLDNLVYGRTPPQAREMEEVLLGAIMMEKGAFDLVYEKIKKPEIFYVDAHQRIYRAMLTLNQRSVRIETLSVVNLLKETEELDVVGGPYYLMELTRKLSVSNVEHWAKVVFERFVKREMIRVGGLMVVEGYDDTTDAFEVLDGAEASVLAIANALTNSEVQHVSSLLVPAIQDIETKVQHYAKNGDYISGITSGFPSIDKITYGWQNTDLIILAARPSVGKTALALNLARNAAMDPVKPVGVAVFSLEMSATQLINRLLSAESEINLEKIMRGKLTKEEQKILYERGVQKLADAKLFIDDTAALNIFELRAKCRRLKNLHNIGLIIIDYLQLMSGTGGRDTNREQEISAISRGLKALAKELGVPVIALSQLSREVEKRAGSKMPVLSDLRESGAIEQDADSVLFIYRPEYHGQHKTATGESTVGETHIRFAKHRNGILETVKLKAQLWIQKFAEMDDVPGFQSPIYNGQGLDKRQGFVSIETAFSQVDQSEGMPF